MASKIVYLLYLEDSFSILVININRGPVITSSEYLYRLSRYRDSGYKYSRGPTITSSEYL